MTLRIAIPNKGRLSESTLDLLDKAGIKVEVGHERRLFAKALGDRFTILFVRAADIPEFVEEGVADVGVTGYDLVRETGRDVEEVMDLRFGSCRLSVAVPAESKWTRAADLPDGTRVATSFPRLTSEFFAKLGKKVHVVEVSGAAEATPHIGVADAIVDLVSSGGTLTINHLREADVILASTARMIANRTALADARGAEIRQLAFALESVVAARGRRYLMANVPRARLDEVRRILPGISGPTVMDLLDNRDMVAAHAVVDEKSLYETVNALKRVGATGILVLPIERLVG